MWPFSKPRKPYQPLSHQNIDEIASKAVAEAIGPSSVIKMEPFSLITHTNTIKGMLEAINTQLETVDRQRSSEAELHETNERQENNRHVIVVERLRVRNRELEQLRDTYAAALKIAAPGADEAPPLVAGFDGKLPVEVAAPGAIDPARMSAVGEKIAETKRTARRNKSVARVDQGASGAIDIG